MGSPKGLSRRTARDLLRERASVEKMRIVGEIHHPVPKDITEAAEIQRSIATHVRIVPLKRRPALVAGVDAAFSNGEIVSAASLFTWPGMRHVEDAVYRGASAFPYIPGYFSFREGPAALKALLGLRTRPDVILVDGQGIAHPRGAGIACYLGVMLGVPAIGCAKSRLIGEFEEPGREKGAWSYLYRTAEHRAAVGAVLRTRTAVKPVFVSPGHLIDIAASLEVVLGCLSVYRIPEPLRRADHLSKRTLRGGKT